VRRGDPAVHPLGPPRPTPPGPRRRRPVAGLHVHRQRRRGQPARRARRGRRRRGLQRRLREPGEPARDHREARDDPRAAPPAPARAAAPGRRGSHARGRVEGQAAARLLAARPVRRGAPAHGRVLPDAHRIARGGLRMRHAMLSLLVAALVTGLATSPAAAEAPTSLVVQTVAEPPGLDLTATPASATAAVVFYNVQEALVKVDRHGKLVPWLAERWHTTDNRNYTFFLKRGVHFHNGRELLAADVKYVFERAMNPETKHPYPGYYASIGDIIVKDDYTITFSLKSLNANFLLNLPRQGSVIYPREAVDTLKTD